MANIRPFDLPPAPNVPSSAAFVIDTGAVVQKASAEQIVDSAIPLATQAAAETGSGNETRMSPLRVKQAIDAQALSQDFLASPTTKTIGFQYGELTDGAGVNLMFRGTPTYPAARLHLEPRTNIDSGITSKTDWMFDPYASDLANYRIVNLYAQTGDPNGTGEGAIAYFGGKSAGNHWGNWPSLHFGFSDDGQVPLKIMMFDHSASQFYTPMRGGWRSGMSVTTGDYVTTLVAGAGRVYVAASTGTTGATVPSHTTGTVSDGGVDWTFVRQNIGSQVNPVVVFGTRDQMPVFGHSTNIAQFLRNFLVGYAVRQNFLKEDKTVGAYFSIGKTGSDEWFYQNTGGGGYIRYHTSQNFQQPIGMARCASVVSAPDGATAPSVVGVETLQLANSGPTTVNALTGGVGGQRVRLVANNGNTTLDINMTATSGGLLRSATGTDIVMTQGGAIDLERHHSSDFWRVVGNF